MTANRVAAATNTGPPIVTRSRGDNSGDVPISVLATWAAGAETDVAVTNPLPFRLSDGSAWVTVLPVSLASTTITGTVAVTQSGTWALGAGSAVIGHVVVDSATLGTVTVSGAVTTSGTATVSGTVAATQSGTWTTVLGAGSAAVGSVTVTSLPAITFASAQPVTLASTTITGTVTTSGTSTVSGTVAVSNAFATDAHLTDGSLRGTVALSAGAAAIGSVIVTSAPTTAVTISTLPALTTGAATIGAVTGPSAVALAKDSTLTDGTQRGTFALSAGSAVIGHVVTDTGSTTAVTGTVTVAGAVTTSGTVTEASGSAIATSTSSTATNTGTIAGAVSGARMLTTEASASAIATSVASTATNTANIPAKGQALAAGSTPVVLTAAQDVVAYAPAKESGGNLATIATQTSTTATNTAHLTDGTQIAIAKGAAAAGAVASGNPVLLGGIDGSGNVRTVRVNASGFVETTAALGSGSQSAAFEPSHVIGTGAIEPSSLAMYNNASGTRFIHTFNATGLPANNAIPYDIAPVGTNGRATMTWALPTGRYGVGFVAGSSSTATTLTVSASDAFFSWNLFPPSA